MTRSRVVYEDFVEVGRVLSGVVLRCSGLDVAVDVGFPQLEAGAPVEAVGGLARGARGEVHGARPHLPRVLDGGWEICSISAALVKLPHSTTVQKYFSRLMSMAFLLYF